jgi:hypothetical protein
MTKGDMVFYSTNAGMFRGRVETMHRDGSVSVLVQHRLVLADPEDNVGGYHVRPGYFGFRVRLDSSDLRLTPFAA